MKVKGEMGHEWWGRIATDAKPSPIQGAYSECDQNKKFHLN